MPGEAIWQLTMQETPSAAGALPGPRGGAYRALPDPLAGGEGAGGPSIRIPPPALGSLGFELRPSPVPHCIISSNAAENYRTTYIHTKQKET